MYIILFIACTSVKHLEDTSSQEIQSAQGRLKIEEVYYSGSVPTAGIDRYYADQFIQLRNNSDETIDIGGIGIGDLFGLAGEINNGSEPDSFADDSKNVYFGNVWTIPLSSPFRYLPPRGCVRIAQDAADHHPYSELSHFDAHFETFVEHSEQDKDDPVVENLESIFYTAGYDWLITVFGPTIVIVMPEGVEEGVIQGAGWTEVFVVPSEYVVDTMEAVMDEHSGEFKRLHSDIDAGFQYVSGTYTGESVRRYSENGHLLDSDNSTNDFFVTPPIADCSTEQ